MLRNPSSIIIFVSALLFVGTPPVFCQENKSTGDSAPTKKKKTKPDSPSAESEVTDSDIHDLIERLGSPLFVEREAASDRLLRIGSAANKPLSEAMDHSDAEIRHRAERLVILIEERGFEKRIRLFEQDADGSKNTTLPGWERFRERFGAEKLTRALFAQVYRAEPDLMKSYERNKAQAQRSYTVRLQSLHQSMYRPTTARKQPSLGSIVALLTIVSDPQIEIVPDNRSNLMFSLVQRNPFSLELQRGKNKPILREMLGGWIKRDFSSNPTHMYQTIMLALRLDLDEVLEPAIKFVCQKNGHTSYRFYAMLAIAKFGDRSNVKDIEHLLNDKTNCFNRRVGKKNIPIQLRDCTLATLLHLVGKDPKKFGFKHLRPHSTYVFNPTSLAFDSDEQRQAALSQWNAYRSTQ